jgi:plastocyanin
MNSGYDDCVQQCINSHGAPPATYTPPTATYGGGGSSGSGSTITVIVAPTQGVLRYVPAFVNASVGTTIEFMWNADNHTVTKGSQLLPCNHTTEDPSFITGIQKKGFTFTQVVNDTNPTFFFCGAPTHCQKGMFGIINPPSNFGSPTSVSGMMQSMTSSDPALEAYAAYSANATEGKSGASWGGSISLEGMPDWSHSLVAENVLYTRNLLAMNPELVKEDGSIDMGSFGSTPLMIPTDFSNTINAAASGDASSTPSGSAGSAGSAGSTDSSAAPQSTDSPTGAASNNNGALSVSSSKAVVAAIALVATFLAL